MHPPFVAAAGIGRLNGEHFLANHTLQSTSLSEEQFKSGSASTLALILGGTIRHDL
jgi:hypothetical protein